MGCGEEEKASFWEMLDTALQQILESEVVIGANLNRNVGRDMRGYCNICGGQGYGTLNDEGESIVQLAQAHDLVVSNTFFTKRDEYLITYKSRRTRSQID